MSIRHDDDAFVERLRDAYEPPVSTPADRVRFDAVLRDRIARRTARRRVWLGAGLASAVAAAAFALFTLGGPTTLEAPSAPAIAEAPVDFDAIAVLAEPVHGLGSSDLFPVDPLTVTGFDDDLASLLGVDEAEEADDETYAADDETEDETGPGWMPDEYDALAALIEVDPYTTEELWP